MKKFVFISFILFGNIVLGQNTGIGTITPVEKLDVSGNIKATGLTINNGGSPHDFLIKSNASGAVGFRKGHGAIGLRYIICVQGGTTPDSLNNTDGSYISEIKIFAGDFPPSGWMFCEGQMLSRSTYSILFSLLGTTYGTTLTSNFGIPDLRGAVPVHSGTSTAGNTWTRGQ